MGEKLSETRRRVLELVDDAAQSGRIARRLGIARTSVSSALQWARNAGLVTWASRWSLTDAGRAALATPPAANSEAYAEAHTFLEELRTFHANDAGDMAIKILRKLFGASPTPITSAELIDRTGGNAGPVDTRGFPSELREPSLSRNGEGK